MRPSSFCFLRSPLSAMGKYILALVIVLLFICKGQSRPIPRNHFQGGSSEKKPISSNFLKYDTPLSRSYVILHKALFNMAKDPTKYKDSTEYIKKGTFMPDLTQDGSAENHLSETSNPAASMKDSKETHQAPKTIIVQNSSPKKDININSIIIKNNEFIIKEIKDANKKPTFKRKHQKGQRTEDMKAFRIGAVSQDTNEEKSLPFSEKHEGIQEKKCGEVGDWRKYIAVVCIGIMGWIIAIILLLQKCFSVFAKKKPNAGTSNFTILKGDDSAETKISVAVDKKPQILNSSELLPSTTESDRRPNLPIYP